MNAAIGRKADADGTRFKSFSHCIKDFFEQAHAVFDAAAVVVCACVDTVLEELVQQVAIGGMYLDPVKACRPCKICRLPVVGYGLRDPLCIQGSRF